MLNDYPRFSTVFFNNLHFLFCDSDLCDIGKDLQHRKEIVTNATKSVHIFNNFFKME